MREFPELRSYGRDGNEVAGWLRERARERAVEIEPQAVEELVDLVGANLWALSSEVEKLGRYASGRSVTVDDVRLLTPQAREESIFGVVDAVMEGRAAPALLLIRRMLAEGSETAQRIQAMIARPATTHRPRHGAAGGPSGPGGGGRGDGRQEPLCAR